MAIPPRPITTADWKPEYTTCAHQIWEEYQRQHDLINQKGKVAAIDPQSERVCIGGAGVDVAQKMEAEGIHAPVYLVRVGSDHFIRKGRRLMVAWYALSLRLSPVTTF